MRCGHCFIFSLCVCVCFILRLEANILPPCDHKSLLLMLSCRGSHQRSISSIPSTLFLSLNGIVHSRRFREVRPGHCRIQQFRNWRSVVRMRATQRTRNARIHKDMNSIAYLHSMPGFCSSIRARSSRKDRPSRSLRLPPCTLMYRFDIEVRTLAAACTVSNGKRIAGAAR